MKATRGSAAQRWLKRVVLLLLCGVLAWVGGFAIFLYGVGRQPDAPARSDAIVALTGGTERVETALHLLIQGRASRLLVSGIGHGTDLPALARRAGLDAAQLEDRVTLGRAATSTHGNAEETAQWARANGVRSLVVVTSFYHMPRALVELRRALPDVSLAAVPVMPAESESKGYGVHGVAMRLLAEEYSKYLLASAGVTGWLTLGRGKQAQAIRDHA